LKSLIGDSSGVRIYSDGTMRSYTVGQLAGNAVEALYDARSTGIEG
jgi:hypothetical protein